MRRTWAALALAVASLSWVVGFAPPARADDCSKLVNGINDLRDKYVLQDCLRTGSNWGRVLGAVVGVAGAGIAAAGLRGRKDVKPGPDPCREAAAAGHRLHVLGAERRALEQKIVGEWQQYARRAQVLVQQFRAIKEAESAALNERVWAATGNLAAIAILLYGLGRAIVAARAAVTTARPVIAEIVALGVPTAQQAATVAQQNAATQAANFAVVYEAAKAAEKLVRSEGTLITDPLGTDNHRKVMDGLMSMARFYNGEARAFNQAFKTWGERRQKELDAIYDRIDEETSRLLANSKACNPDSTLPDPGPIERVQIHVLEVATQLEAPYGISPWGGQWFAPRIY